MAKKHTQPKPKKREERRRKRANAAPKWHWWSKLQLISIGGDSERSYVLEYLALLIRSGMELAEAVRAIRGELRNPALRYKVYQIELDVESGINIADAFERSKLFPRQVVSLMRIGEVSGRLPENLEAIVEQQEKDRTFKSQLQSASLYPIFVLAVTGVVGIAIAWFILPQLASVFTTLDMDLPLITEIVIAIGLFLADYGNIVIPSALLGFIVLLYFVFLFPKTKIIGQWILFKTPGIRRLIQEVELSRFGTVMGSLLQAGLPIDESLDALHASTGFYRYRRMYKSLKEAIVSGESFEDFFETLRGVRGVVPSPIQQIVIAAERSGELPEAFAQIGETYERKTEITTKNLSVVLEPLLLIIVWLGVISVALSVILPVYNLVGGITNQPGIGGTTNVRVDAIDVIGEGGLDVITDGSDAETLTDDPTDGPSGAEIVPVEGVSPEGVPGSEEETSAVPGDDTLAEIEATQAVIVESAAGILNLREEASSGAIILQVLENGQQLQVVGENANGWLQVQIDDLVGWVSSLYVREGL